MARYRLTGAGLALPGGAGASAQWERKDDDREIARRVINILNDRRLLWIDMRYEVPDECIRSASQTRDRLTEQMNNPDIGRGLETLLRAMQAAFQDFMTQGRRYEREWGRWSHLGPDEFSVALGELRRAVGEIVGIIAAGFELDVPAELASIVPDSSAWFFERFA